MPLWLPPGVHFCVAAGHGVFLDLNADAYSAIPIETGRWDLPGEEAEVALSKALAPHAQDLLAAGLLTLEPKGAASLDAFLTITAPTAHILHPADIRLFGLGREIWGRRRVSPFDVIEVLRACQWAADQLAKKHIRAIVEEVAAARPGESGRDVDANHLRSALAVFGRVRPWFPRGYLCLFDSLALMRFLSRRGLCADWIFGVRVQPFGAHCWIQKGDLLLNEDSEFAHTFVPIMRVSTC